MGLLAAIIRDLFTPRVPVLDVAKRELVPYFEAQGMRVHRFAERWPNGPVDLEMGDLVIRLQLDRGILEVMLGSRAEQSWWFGMNEVQQHLGVPTRPWPSQELPSVTEIVVELRSLLQAHLPEILNLFDRRNYAEAKRGLMETRRIINNRLSPGRRYRASTEGGSVGSDEAAG
jgi:hypothetical protein